MIKASKITLGLFSSGFILYSLYKYFSQKNITKEQISKIIKKISDLSVYFMFQYYDTNNKISNQKKEEQNFSEERKIYKFTNSEEKFDNEVLNTLEQILNKEIKTLGITKEEFQEYLTEYKENDIDIENNYNLIQKVFNSFKQRKLPEINFGFIIPEKYLQIISNIFYFNLRKSYLVYYNKINSIKNITNTKAKKEMFSNIYNININQTRKEIAYFFGIGNDNNLEINIKLALKIFPFYYDINHFIRKKYEEIKNNVNKIINKIINIGYKIDVLINENNMLYIKEPVDRIINFDVILNNIYTKDNFFINDEEIPYEDQCD